MVKAHHRSAKHQRGSFHETKSCQTFLKDAVPDFADKLLFVLFQQKKTIGLLSNTSYENLQNVMIERHDSLCHSPPVIKAADEGHVYNISFDALKSNGEKFYFSIKPK